MITRLSLVGSCVYVHAGEISLKTTKAFTHGGLVFDATKPDGTPRKLLDVSLLHSLGWHHTTGLEEGLRRTSEAVRTQLT